MMITDNKDKKKKDKEQQHMDQQQHMDKHQHLDKIF